MALAISEPVAEELREQLEVRRLAAAGAGAGELEQRLRASCVPLTSSCDRACGPSSGSVEEERRSVARSASRCRRRAPCRAPCGAGSTCPWPGRPRRRGRSRCSPRARPGSCSASPARSRGLAGDASGSPRGAPASARRVVDLGADRRVRADERALVALDADRRVPDRDLERDGALLPLRLVPDRPRAVGREGADRQQVALAREHQPAVTRCTKSGASGRAPAAGGVRSAVAARRHRRPRAGARARASTAAKLRRDDLGAALAVGLLDRRLGSAPIASSRGSTPESAKKQVCITVLMRRPRPARLGDARTPSMTKKRQALLDDRAPAPRAAACPRPRSAGTGVLSRNVAPGAAPPSTSSRSRNSGSWQATNCALRDQVGRADRPRAEAQVRDRRSRRTSCES